MIGKNLFKTEKFFQNFSLDTFNRFRKSVNVSFIIKHKADICKNILKDFEKAIKTEYYKTKLWQKC